MALAEKKIGEELERGREGRILKAHEQTRRMQERGTDTHHAFPATVAELGLTKRHNRDFTDMAAVPAEVIHQAVEAANAEGKVATKVEMKRAGGGARRAP
jgi:hypothetical protein